AQPRRSPPVRHHVPPPAPREAHDEERARRRAGPRARTEEAAAEGDRRRGRGQSRVAGGPSDPELAAGPGRPRPLREAPRAGVAPSAATGAVHRRGHRQHAPRMTDDKHLWEQHAAWWQEGFTGGADPEY